MSCAVLRVGYQIRFDSNVTKHTKIIFLTEGLVLRQVRRLMLHWLIGLVECTG